MQKVIYNKRKIEEAANVLKTLSHPIRLCIIRGIHEMGECNVNYIQECMGLPQSTISTHLSRLRSGGILIGKREGNEVIYSIRDKKSILILESLGVI